jgi:hypothetical protein
MKLFRKLFNWVWCGHLVMKRHNIDYVVLERHKAHTISRLLHVKLLHVSPLRYVPLLWRFRRVYITIIQPLISHAQFLSNLSKKYDLNFNDYSWRSNVLFDKSNYIDVCMLEVTIHIPTFKHWSSIMYQIIIGISIVTLRGTKNTNN